MAYFWLMISAASIQEVRDRADIVEVVGHFLHLKRRGVNYLALCPFHNEKTPSFNVNPSRGIYKCFGCGRGGDALSFIQEHEKFSFVETVRWLADFYHIELEETQDSAQTIANRQIEESLRILFEFAIQYFEHNLHHTEEGQTIGLSYFKERGFTQQIIESFRLGYALESWDAFLQHAIKNGYTEELLIHSGLVSHKNEKKYDTYRARVIFPIAAASGKIVGLGARILQSNTKAPKYINSPESEIYNKSKILYGLYQSRNAINKFDQCYLVEGYTDVLSLHQFGIENVVSSSGTSLTEGQLRLLKNLSKNLTIIYDGDVAGIQAAIRGMQMALSESFQIRIVQLPENQDPDSYVQKVGAQTFRDYVQDHSKDVIDFQIDLKAQKGTIDAQTKSALTQELAETIALANKPEDFVLQQEMIRKAAQKLDIQEQGLAQLVSKLVRENLRKEQRKWIDQQRSESETGTTSTPETETSNTTVTLDTSSQKTSSSLPIGHLSTDSGVYKSEWKVAQVLLKYGDKPYEEDMDVAQYFFEHFEMDTIEQESCRKIVLKYQELKETGKSADEIMLFFIRNSDSELKNKAIELLLDEEQPNEKWNTEIGLSIPSPEENYLEEVKSTYAYFELNVLDKLIREVMKEIQSETVDIEEQMDLLKIHKELKEREKSLLSLVVRKS